MGLGTRLTCTDSCPDYTGRDGGGNSSRGKRHDTKESSCTETWEVSSIALHEIDPAQLSNSSTQLFVGFWVGEGTVFPCY